MLVLVPLAAALMSAAVPPRPGTSVQPVLDALKAHLARPMHDGLSQNARFGIAFTDLNGDGRAEALVYLVDENWCGSGGCMTFVFKPVSPTRWKWVSSTTLTELPIYELPGKHHGWKDLGVSVRPDYVKGGLVALRFNGSSYTSNPTVAPVKFARDRAKLLISDDYRQLHDLQGGR